MDEYESLSHSKWEYQISMLCSFRRARQLPEQAAQVAKAHGAIGEAAQQLRVLARERYQLEPRIGVAAGTFPPRGFCHRAPAVVVTNVSVDGGNREQPKPAAGAK